VATDAFYGITKFADETFTAGNRYDCDHEVANRLIKLGFTDTGGTACDSFQGMPCSGHQVAIIISQIIGDGLDIGGC
jgi:hypothetical protein